MAKTGSLKDALQNKTASNPNAAEAIAAAVGQPVGMKRPDNRKRKPKSRLNVNLDTDLYDRFQELADREGGSMTFLVTQYVKAAVEADDGLPWR